MAFISIDLFIKEHSSNFDESTKSAIENEFKTVFDMLQSVEIRKRLSGCFEEVKVKTSSSNLKSISNSNKYREEGNRLFKADKKGNALAASRSYTNALLAAPMGSPELALAHANRAAALIEFGYYFDAYCDCSLAINLGYPKEKHVKILMRQAHCAVKLKNYFKLEDALEKLKDLHLNEQYLKQRKDFEEQLKIIAELPPGWQQDDPHDYKVQNILLHPKKGRYMTAWKDYQKDDMILSEKAFAFVPVHDVKICSFCANAQFIPYPCYSCSKVVYCSQKCKLAHDKIHQYECFAYRSDLDEYLGITHLAMRSLICGLPEILSELINCSSAQEIWEKIETIGKSGKKGYPQILSLYSNLHLLSPKTIHAFAVVSIVVAICLVSGTTFSELYSKSPCSSLDWLIVISALITRHTIQMIVNAQSSIAVVYRNMSNDFLALGDIWNEPHHLKKRHLHGFIDIEITFAGIYPYLSLCNHSCEPSLRLNFDGNHLIAKARYGLKTGDEVFNSYVLNCRSRSRSNRTEELMSLFFFECDCKHCAPETKDNEYLKLHGYRCKNCNKLLPSSISEHEWYLELEGTSIKCPYCKTGIEVDWFSKFNKIFKANILNRTELIEAFKLFRHSEKILYLNNLRQYMAYKIVTSFFEMWREHVVEEKFFNEIAEVLRHWLDHIEKQSDVESVLYATTSTFVLDLMAEGKMFDFDKKKIRRSFDMLPTELKTIFENYIKDYIGDRFDEYVENVNEKI